MAERAIHRRASDLAWQPHPEARGLMMKSLMEIPGEGVTTRLHRVPPDGIPDHSHDRRHIMWVISGAGRARVDGLGDIDLEAGSFLFVPSGTSHQFYPDGDLELYTVSLPPVANK